MTGEAFTLLEEGSEYELLGSADGASFVLRFKTDHMTAYLEGDDAARFQADRDAIKAQYPDWPADKALAQLWDQGGYSWLAVEEEGV